MPALTDPRSNFARILTGLVGLAALSAAGYSLVLARALQLFEEDTGPAVAGAVQLAPFNSSYLLRLAAWKPDQRHEMLQKAVAVNRFEEDAWTRLGLEAELQRHDPKQAEADLLQAAAIDHMFLPRWTLTNFYFRQRRRQEFFHWAKLAMEMTPYPADPVLAEMWLFEPNPDTVAQYVPNRPTVLAQYIMFLANVRQYPAIARVVTRLVSTVGPSQGAQFGLDDIIGPLEDQMLSAGYGSDALQVWQALRAGHWIAESKPDVDTPLTNGNFQVAIWPHAFDWAPIGGEGVMTSQNASTPEMQIQLTGEQPEHCSLMRQWLPVAQNRKYLMSWTGDVSGLPKNSGIHWTLHAATVQLQSPDMGGARSWSFAYTGPSQMALLTLDYDRPWGETRAHGALRLQAVSLHPE